MLCVDDNKELLKNLALQFVEEDFEVDTAEDGDIALQKIAEHHYDIVLLDLKLKNMNGVTVLKEMKKINKNPYVIVLTAVNDLPMAQECISLGAKDYITKPYDPEELLDVVIKVLGS